MPYMCDPRHAPDTLFFVSEEDWRLFPEDEAVDADAVAAEVFAAHGGGPLPGFPEVVNLGSRPTVSLFRAFDHDTGEPLAPEDSHGPPQDSHSAGVKPKQPGWEQVAGRFYKRQPKASRTERGKALPASQELSDMVKMITAASRSACGEIVWLSWNGRKTSGHRAKPSYGSQLIAVTHTGAKALAEAFDQERVERGHWDISLRTWLLSPEGKSAVAASYLYPAVGSFKGHTSGCDPKLGVRNPQWGQNWCQAGTRKSDVRKNSRDRHFGLFTVSGVQWVRQVVPESEADDLNWKTLKPQEDQAARAWHDWGRKHRGAPELLTGFAAHQEVLDEESADYAFRRSKRKRRAARAAMVSYSFRDFVEDPREAGMTKEANLCIDGRISESHWNRWLFCFGFSN